MVTFSVIIPWYQRPEIRRTLEANAELFARHSAEVVVVNCGGDPEEASSLIDSATIPDLRQVVVPHASFNRALAKNIGVSCSSGRLLFFLDADIVLRSDVFSETRAVLEHERCYVYIRRVHESDPRPDPRMSFIDQHTHTRELICGDGRKAVVQMVTYGDGGRCGQGLLLMRREHLLEVGGFNAALEGWGFEDMDLQLRLQFALSLTAMPLGEVVHLSHGDDRRNLKRGSRGEDQEVNMYACFANYSRSMYTGTYAEDVKLWRDRILSVACGASAP